MFVVFRVLGTYIADQNFLGKELGKKRFDSYFKIFAMFHSKFFMINKGVKTIQQKQKYNK